MSAGEVVMPSSLAIAEAVMKKLEHFASLKQRLFGIEDAAAYLGGLTPAALATKPGSTFQL
jgi:hypothetical protein